MTASNGGAGENGSAGTQTTGSSFGTGGTGIDHLGGGGGGGAGFRGGLTGGEDSPGSGGSGWIGSSNLVSRNGNNKHMTCYSCSTSNNNSTRTISNALVSSSPKSDYSKKGNGYVIFTYDGEE